MFGVDIAELDLEPLPDSWCYVLEHEYGFVRSRRKPTWRVYTGKSFGEITTYERLILTFAKQGSEISMLMVTVYEVKNDGLFDIH